MRKPLGKRGGLGIIALAGVGVLAFMCWPRGPRLAWYVSPPVLVKGKPVRVRILAPAGSQFAIESVLTRQAGDTFVEKTCLTWTRPGSRFSIDRLPEWLVRTLRLSNLHREYARVDVILDYVDDKTDEAVFVERDKHHPTACPSSPHHEASRALLSPKAHMLYWSYDRAEFDATYRQICESFKVIK